MSTPSKLIFHEVDRERWADFEALFEVNSYRFMGFVEASGFKHVGDAGTRRHVMRRALAEMKRRARSPTRRCVSMARGTLGFK